jgi:serine/threonine protein kinase
MTKFIYIVDVEHQGILCYVKRFVAPEVINIKDLTTKYDKVCDVYSLGLVFHLLLTGKPAFTGRSYTTIVN